MNILYFYLFETGAIISLFLILFKERKNKEIFKSVILAFIYGLLLEALNVHLSDSYFYGREFFLQIYDIPIAIAAGWAIIYYAAQKTVEGYGLKWWQTPFLMAFFALSLDIAMDAVAIRIGFWSWRIPLNEEWFGVPYDNLFGWLAVVWTFSFFINLSRQKFLSAKASKAIKYGSVFASPLLLSFQITLYVSLASLISGRFNFGEIAGFYARHDFSYAYYLEVQRTKAYIFFMAVFVLAAYLFKVIYAGRKKICGKFDVFSFFMIFAAHLFFLSILFTEGIYREIPALVLISFAMLIFHTAISLLPGNSQ